MLVVVEKHCLNCNTTFSVKRRWVEKIPKDERKCCSIHCARSYSTKAKRKEINKKVSETLRKKFKPKPKQIKRCKFCGKAFKVKHTGHVLCSRTCTGKYSSPFGKAAQMKNPPNWSKIHKKAYKEGRNQVAGGTSKWLTYKDIKVQGTYELRTCSILDKWKEQGKIKNWEYTNDRFQYVGADDKNHSYLVDFKIFDINNSFYYLEVKGWEDENDKFKWESVKKQGYKLEIWFIHDINKYEEQLMEIA
jgi:hypothetical protein